ncbi:hypothetical protein CSAL01_09549 [Colletotrichum salicis]|uniref:Uncharacterized protein n=1 Tax=Colletotrichum salicis TaxID=1209931 RepID=A0A135UGN5_9PEZI|nr:hypothetical protein CSAL01_09549 [Colletotrichum salicis]
MQISAIFLTVTAFAVGNSFAGKHFLVGSELSTQRTHYLLPSADHVKMIATVPRNFIDGKGSALFGNVGTACSVGSQDGECDRFGLCVQEIPPNEVSVLNQGKTVATCTAGGQTGTL